MSKTYIHPVHDFGFFLLYISKNDIQILDPWVFGYEKCWLAQIFKGPKRWQERQSGEAAPAEKASKLSRLTPILCPSFGSQQWPPVPKLL